MSARAADRQVLAQGKACDILPFACAPRLADSAAMSIVPALGALDTAKCLPCDTFPLNWPSPVRVGSFFFGKPISKK